MDYVREELRRQREALSRLLLGSGRTAPVEEESGGDIAVRYGEKGPDAVPSPWREDRSEGTVLAREWRREAAGERTAGALQQAAPEARWSLSLERAAEAVQGEMPAHEFSITEDVWGRAGMRQARGRSFRAGTAEAVSEEPRTEPIDLLPGEMPGISSSLHTAETAGTGLASAGPAGDAGAPGESEILTHFSRQRTVTEILWPGGGEATDAKALSRTFQRDARRYDGGFSLY